MVERDPYGGYFQGGRNSKWLMHGPGLSLPRRMYIQILPSRLGGFKHEFSFLEAGPLIMIVVVGATKSRP